MRTRILTWTLVAVFALCALAQESKIPDETIPSDIPYEYKVMKNPVPRTAESVDHGMLLFSSQCAMCHGKTGRGDGAFASRLEMLVPDFTDSNRMKKRTDGELFYIITKGHGRMPADGERLSPEWRWNMVNAIRSMTGP